MNAIFEWISRFAGAFKFWVVVNPWERCVRVRAGKNTKELEAGIHWRIPFVDEVLIVNHRLRIAISTGQQPTTRDGRTVNIAANLGIRIDSPEKALKAFMQPEYTCAALVQGIFAQYVFTRDFDELSPIEMQTEAKAELEQIADGFAVEFVNVTDFAPVNRTFRVIGDDWKPQTRVDLHDKE